MSHPPAPLSQSPLPDERPLSSTAGTRGSSGAAAAAITAVTQPLLSTSRKCVCSAAPIRTTLLPDPGVCRNIDIRSATTSVALRREPSTLGRVASEAFCSRRVKDRFSFHPFSFFNRRPRLVERATGEEGERAGEQCRRTNMARYDRDAGRWRSQSGKIVSYGVAGEENHIVWSSF